MSKVDRNWVRDGHRLNTSGDSGFSEKKRDKQTKKEKKTKEHIIIRTATEEGITKEPEDEQRIGWNQYS